MKKLLVAIFVVLTLTNSSFAGDFHNNLRTFMCGSQFSPITAGDPAYDYFWASIAYNPVTEVTDWFSYSNSIGMGLLGSRSASAPQIEYRILLKLTKGKFYMVFGPGLSHAFNPGDLPHVANSPIFGLITVEVGYQLNALSIGYTYEHLSSPFHDDSGWNVGGVALSVRF